MNTIRRHGGKKAPTATERKRGRPALNRRRVMVPMEPEVLTVFERMAGAASLPVGRVIADWCRDTADGALFVANKMVEARKAPQIVMREMEAMGEGMLSEIRRLRDVGSTRGKGG